MIKGLIIGMLIFNILALWEMVKGGLVKFNPSATPDGKQPETEKPPECVEKFQQPLVVPNNIDVGQLKAALAEVIPAMVRKEVDEIIHEKDVTFDSPKMPDKFKPVDDIDKAFEDCRDGGLSESTPVVPDGEDDAIPDFNEVDSALNIISDREATPQQKAQAMNVAVCLEDSNIIVALPEPLHSRLVEMLATAKAAEIEGEGDAEHIVTVIEPENKKPHNVSAPKAIPDDIEDFNPLEF